MACIAGADAARYMPAEVGPPTVQPDGSLTFEMLRVDDLEDYRVCGSVSGHMRRVLEAVSITTDGPVVQMLGQYEVPAGSTAPRVTVFPIASDGHDGRLAPWTIRYDGNEMTESHVAHLTPDGLHDYTLSVAGPIVPLGKDLGAMTDGSTLIVFHLLTGEVQIDTHLQGRGRQNPAPTGRDVDDYLPHRHRDPRPVRPTSAATVADNP